MRPRQIRRGEHEGGAFGGKPDEGFNAATPNSAWRTSQGFLRGKVMERLQCGHAEFGVENDVTRSNIRRSKKASMRPRRIRRGEPHGIRTDCLRDTRLQCGHAEFGVEN